MDRGEGERFEVGGGLWVPVFFVAIRISEFVTQIDPRPGNARSLIGRKSPVGGQAARRDRDQQARECAPQVGRLESGPEQATISNRSQQGDRATHSQAIRARNLPTSPSRLKDHGTAQPDDHGIRNVLQSHLRPDRQCDSQAARARPAAPGLALVAGQAPVE